MRCRSTVSVHVGPVHEVGQPTATLNPFSFSDKGIEESRTRGCPCGRFEKSYGVRPRVLGAGDRMQRRLRPLGRTDLLWRTGIHSRCRRSKTRRYSRRCCIRAARPGVEGPPEAGFEWIERELKKKARHPPALRSRWIPRPVRGVQRRRSGTADLFEPVLREWPTLPPDLVRTRLGLHPLPVALRGGKGATTFDT